MNRNIQYLVSPERFHSFRRNCTQPFNRLGRMSETRLFSKLALGGALGFVFGADLSLGKRSLDPASLCTYFGAGYVASSIADIFSHPLDYLKARTQETPGLASAIRRAGGVAALYKPVFTPGWWLAKAPASLGFAFAFTAGCAFAPTFQRVNEKDEKDAAR